jgi:O-antigen ligase
VTVLVSDRGRGAGTLAWLAAVLVAAPIEGGLVTVKPVLAVVLPIALAMLLAAELPVALVLGGLLLARALTDDGSTATSRASSALDSSGVIAAVLLIVAFGLLLRNQRSGRHIAAVAGFIVIWSLVAAYNLGLSPTTLREGLRELSLLAVAVIVVQAPKALSLRSAARLAQLIAIVPAAVVVYQVATGRGMLIGTDLRANGTFSHPNSAGVFLAIAALASLWLYLEHGRRLRELAATGLFLGALVGTYSIGGMAAFLVMLLVLGTARRSRAGIRLAAWAVAAVTAIVFVLTPIGASRLQTESNLSATGGNNTSLTWRFSNWGSLVPLYESSPVIGQGLGVTVLGDTTKGALPHNEWVRYLVETGTVGMALIVAGLLMVLRRLWRLRRSWPAEAPLAIALIVGLLFDCIGANTLLYTPAAYLAAMLLGSAWRTIGFSRDAVAAAA